MAVGGNILQLCYFKLFRVVDRELAESGCIPCRLEYNLFRYYLAPIFRFSLNGFIRLPWFHNDC